MSSTGEPVRARTRPTHMRGRLMAIAMVGVLTVVGSSSDPDPDPGTDPDSAGVALPSSSAISDATPSAPHSAIPLSYRYVLESSCGERGFLGRYRVVLRDGVVASTENLNDDYPYRLDLAEVPTLAGLLEKAESAKPQAIVDLVLDGSGRPKSLEIDHLPHADDDEECYPVSALRVLG